MTRAMNIGEAAEAAGISAKMIRHYEQIGLVPAAGRTDAGYRQYGERDVSVLRFIRQARKLGFSIEQIAELLGLWSDSRRASRTVKALAQRHLDDLDQKMRELAEMRASLERLVQACHGDDRPHCAILDELALHSPAAPASAPRSRANAPAANASRAAKSRAGATGRAAAAQRASAASASHVDLMAWTHAVNRTPARP